MNKPVICAIACLFLLFAACKPDAGKAGKTSPEFFMDSTSNDNGARLDTNSYANSTISYEIIPAPEGTFGYNILSESEVIISQTSVPGRPGLKGFSNEQDAMKVAGLVMGKLMNHEMPPTVTADDLKRIGVVE